ncbi:MAG: transposase [Anaerolineales bacterium]
MTRYDPARHQRPFGSAQGRHSIRLKGYDYSQPGAYFITPCAWRRQFTFESSAARMAVQAAWDNLLSVFAGVQLDEFVVMPNHVHGVILILEGGAWRLHPGRAGRVDGNGSREGGPRKGGQLPAPTPSDPAPITTPITLGHLVGAFKTMAASAINQIRNDPGAVVWQRNYHDRIIRNEAALDRIRQYIRNNPLQWALDMDNPVNWGQRPPPDSADDYLRDAGVMDE